MDRDQARATVVDYLVGRRIEAQSLRTALAALKEDAGYLAHLREELGLDTEWETECEAVRAALPEYCELSAPQRTREMPEMSAHLGACSACRRLYWDVRDVWGTIGRQGRRVVKRLTDAIRVAVDLTGRLVDVDVELPSAAVVPVGAMMGADEEQGGSIRAWRLHDDERDVTIQLTVEGTEKGARVRCAVAGGTTPPDDQIEIELTNAAGDVFLKSSLAAQGTRSIDVPRGAWHTRVILSDIVWEMPLVIAAAPTPEEGR